MGDIIPFPNEYSKLIKKARDFEDKGDHLSAFQTYQAAYRIEKSFDVNQKLVYFLFDRAEFDQVLSYQSDYIDRYIENYSSNTNDSKDLSIYMTSLLETKSYEDFLEVAKLTLNLTDQQLAEDFKLDMDKYEKEMTDHFQSLTKDLFNLGNFSLSDQLIIASKYYAYDDQDYLEASELSLKNKYVHPLTKSVMIEGLLVKGHKESFEYTFMGQVYTVDLKRVSPMKSDPVLQNLLTTAEEMYADNPSDLAVVMKEVNTDFMYLYPLHDQFIEDYRDWVGYYQVFYGLSGDFHPDTSQETYEFFEKLQSFKLSNYK